MDNDNSKGTRILQQPAFIFCCLSFILWWILSKLLTGSLNDEHNGQFLSSDDVTQPSFAFGVLNDFTDHHDNWSLPFLVSFPESGEGCYCFVFFVDNPYLLTAVVPFPVQRGHPVQMYIVHSSEIWTHDNKSSGVEKTMRKLVSATWSDIMLSGRELHQNQKQQNFPGGNRWFFQHRANLSRSCEPHRDCQHNLYRGIPLSLWIETPNFKYRADLKSWTGDSWRWGLCLINTFFYVLFWNFKHIFFPFISLGHLHLGLVKWLAEYYVLRWPALCNQNNLQMRIKLQIRERLHFQNKITNPGTAFFKYFYVGIFSFPSIFGWKLPVTVGRVVLGSDSLDHPSSMKFYPHFFV